ncbi:MAG: alkaline phosphatase family protein, partial [Candidatus Methylomirabilis sp.]|nr:alkaline phosphatase family protein [Deltaproteobacteria bacterium]
PCVSSVAWASYMTGKNPGKHGILGFVDRKMGTEDIVLPNVRQLRGDTLWDLLSRAGKRVVVMNVPPSFPPRAVNGALVGCFLSPSVKKATHPPELGAELEAMGYRLDADAKRAQTDLRGFVQDVHEVLARRIEAMRMLLARYADWDFAQLHLMETDRLNHFVWKRREDGDPEFAPAFLNLYKRVDAFVGELLDKDLAEGDELIVLSDHGFCTIKKQVMLNNWLAERGHLRFRDEKQNGLGNIDPASTAFSLIPGRIYVNLAGREAGGRVDMAEYERVRAAVKADLLALRAPDGEPVVERVYYREELFWDGAQRGPAAPGGYDVLQICRDSPDLVAAPRDGYDLKARLGPAPALFHEDALQGMHTVHDAVLFWRGRELRAGEVHMTDVLPSILGLYGIPVPPDVDGRGLLG